MAEHLNDCRLFFLVGTNVYSRRPFPPVLSVDPFDFKTSVSSGLPLFTVQTIVIARPSFPNSIFFPCMSVVLCIFKSDGGPYDK